MDGTCYETIHHSGGAVGQGPAVPPRCSRRPHARRADGHLRQRRDVPRHRARRSCGCCAGSGSTSSSRQAQTCCGQPMVNTGYLDEAVPVVRTFVDAFAGYDAVVDAVGLVRRVGAPPARDRGRAARATPALAGGGRARPAPRVYELSEFLVDVLGVDRRRRLLPAPGDLPPDLPLAADARRRRPARAGCSGGARAAAGRRCPAAERVLRLRRHLRGEERRHLGGDGRPTRRGTCATTGAEVLVAGDNSCLMHIGGLLSRQRAGVRVDAPGRDPGLDRARRPARCGIPDGALSATFVGMPPFPEAARDGAGRHPAARTTWRTPPRTIRDKRAARRRRGRRLGGAARWPARRSRTTRLRAPRRAPARSSRQSLTARGRDGALGARRRGGLRDRRRRSPSATASTRWSRSSRWPPRRSASTRPWPREGIAAWETDLAELIVQLGDDLPSHILVPAIHRNRAEIREIFRDRMAAAGRPGARRPDRRARPSSPAAARLHLREKFLRAKVAVSGANFAVAETGTLVVVESEGNGRMCLTLPEVLVSRRRHREGGADLAGPRRVPAAAAAVRRPASG